MTTSDNLPVQAAFDDLGAPLHAVEFVVVDLETTGGSAKDCHITEIGAVRSRGGELLGEFQTLVNPGVSVPPFISALTGITDAKLAGAPRINSVLPAFLEFAHGAVLVAHNAGFDMSFLKAACREVDLAWPAPTVLDTARLARVLMSRDEVRNNKLATLAKFFRAESVPDHRALHDARATMTVLHGLLERAAGFGVTHLEDILQISAKITKEQRSKRTLANDLPDKPGVYVFLGPDNKPLYVGKSKSIRTRVRSYFTRSEQRGRMMEMIRIAQRVHPIPCVSDLEAQVREIRLIAEHRPPYNRRSRHPERAVWLKLTAEPFPRLVVARTIGADIDRGAEYVGPFASRSGAKRAREAIHSAVPLRTCTPRIAKSTRSPACISAELGTCCAPCIDPDSHDHYRDLASQAAIGMRNPVNIVELIRARMRQLAQEERFEEATQEREQLRSLLLGAQRMTDRILLGGTAEIVAARANGRIWEVHVIRYGRLAGTTVVRPDDAPKAVVAAAVATAEHVSPPGSGETAALPEESSLISRWLWQPGIRLVSVSEPLSFPSTAPQRFAEELPQPVKLGEPSQRISATTVSQVSRISLAAPDSTAAFARSN